MSAGAGTESGVTGLGWRDHLEGLRHALLAFTRNAERAGLRADVPTTPEWTVRRLIAHQGMVHRWAAAQLRGEQVATAQLEQKGIDAVDPLDWLRDGAVEVATAIAQTDAQADAQVDAQAGTVFLADAGPPREFWARRQCHETTIHAVDALSAQLGRLPTSADTWIDPVIAQDGIDELLTGFLPRPVSRLRSEEPMTIGVRCDDFDSAWLVQVGPEQPVTSRVPVDGAEVADSDVLLQGPAMALYLTLWNRSDEVRPESGYADWSWAEAAVTWGRKD